MVKQLHLNLIIFFNLFTLTMYTQNFNPRNTIIVVDMDDVFVRAHKFDLGAYFLNLVFFKNPSFLWQMATDASFRTAISNIYSKTGNNNGGSTYNLAMTAQLFPSFQTHFDEILTKFHSGRSLINEVINLLIAIKSAGYTLMVATNRDRVAFEIIMNTLHLNTLYHGSPLFDLAITGEKCSFIKMTTLPNGTRFSKLRPNPLWNDYIVSVTGFKPEKSYFEGLRTAVNAYAGKHPQKYDTSEPPIIFFDDQRKNVVGAALSNCGITSFIVPQSNKAYQMRLDLKSRGINIPPAKYIKGVTAFL